MLFVMLVGAMTEASLTTAGPPHLLGHHTLPAHHNLGMEEGELHPATPYSHAEWAHRHQPVAPVATRKLTHGRAEAFILKSLHFSLTAIDVTICTPQQRRPIRACRDCAPAFGAAAQRGGPPGGGQAYPHPAHSERGVKQGAQHSFRYRTFN